MKDEVKRLNREQLEAVRHGGGPLLIIAGAGTGKTTVVTERIKYLILKKKILPSEILALTFTDKAAREMEERVDIALPYGYTQMWISTFHSFCDRILRNEAVHVGLTPAYKLMSEAETILFLRKNLFQFKLNYFRPLGNPNKFLEGMLQHFSRLKDEDTSPEEYLKYANKQISNEEKEETDKYLELAKAYQVYEELKVKEGVVDYADLITNALKLFRTRKNVLEEYQKKFKAILVDEFQDTNFAQNELVKLLAGKPANLTVVADDDQCLPPGTMIETPTGPKKIEKIKIGDKIITAVGKGYTSMSEVLHVNKTKKKVRFLTFITDNGTKITTTDNHKMFCLVPSRVYGKDKFYYVYLMERIGLGWRLGITNDLVQRLRLERSADRIIGIKACHSEEEARYYETLYALTYHLPTVAFKARKGMVIKNDWLEKLYHELDTNRDVKQLATDLGIDLKTHHFCLAGVVRGQKTRVKVNLRICKRRHRTKWARGRYLENSQIRHEINLETSDKKTIQKLNGAGYKLASTKKGYKIRKFFKDLPTAGKFAQKLNELIEGILDIRFDVAKKNGYARQAQVMPAGNILPGHYLPVLKGYEIIYEKILESSETIKKETVYDLEIAKTHNFIANGVIVHNSIYKWRGAAISNVIQFRKTFPKVKIITLTKNYRSTQKILDAAYKLIQNNNPDRLEVKEKINKKLISVRAKAGQEPEFLSADRVENEAELVMKKISELITHNSRLKYSDFAILVRANNHADPFVRALSRANIPYQFLGPGQLFRQEEVKDLIAYLKVLYNFEDNVSLYRILSQDWLSLLPRDLAAISNFAKRKNLSLFESLEKIEEIFVNDQSKKIVKQVVTMINRHLKLLPKETAGQILYYFLEEAGILKKIAQYKTQREEKEAQNIAKFFGKLKTFEAEHEDATISAVVPWIDLSMQMGESPLASNIDWTENNAVNILTIHSSKGLEFPIVFLVNLVAGRFPTRERREQIPIPEDLIKEILPVGDYHLEEERRLFYVGATRARDSLFLTAADFYGEGKRERKISPFVYEALGEKAIRQSSNLTMSDQSSILEWSQSPVLSSTFNFPPSASISYLSYSQIETFNACPLHYKAKYILKLQTPQSAAQSFGTSLHQTLRDFYQRILSKEKIDEKMIFEILKNQWLSDGYQSKKHEELAFKKGMRILSDYLQKNFDWKNLPLSLELPFQFKIPPDLKIGGKIDRIDQLKNGKAEILDYKTGANIPSQHDLDKNLQLTIYALAATEVAEHPLGKIKPEEIFLSFYFLETGKKLTTQRTKEQLEEAKEELIKKALEISKSDFHCSAGKLCLNCEYKMLCL